MNISLKKILNYSIITYAVILSSCAHQSNIASFTNQKLTYQKTYFDKPSQSDSTSFVYRNSKYETFHIKVATQEGAQLFSKIDSMKTCDFQARKISKHEYVIDQSSIKKRK